MTYALSCRCTGAMGFRDPQVSKRMVTPQQMRWRPRGAHLLLQVRTRALNADLRTAFHRWYPTLDADPKGQDARQAA
jgi:hypothetical protein